MSSSPPPPAAASENELDSFRKKWIEEVNQANSSSSSTTTEDHQESPLRIYARAVYYERTGLLDNALRDYRKALRLEPNVDRAYHHLNVEEIQSFENHFNTEPSFSFQTEQQLTTTTTTGSRSEEATLPRLKSESTQTSASQQHPHSTNKFLEYLLTSFENNPWIRNPDQTKDNDDPRSSVLSAEEEEEEEDRSIDEVNKNLSTLKIDGHIKEVPVVKINQLKFEPLNLDLKSFIQTLPLELFNDHIFCPHSYQRSRIHLLITIIESFAKVSRLARIITLSQSLWYRICISIYDHDLFVNHSLTTTRLSIHSICKDKFDLDWRRMFILL